MLRGDTIICGTSTNGTGTLTLAACPNPPGGVDFYQWLTATGLNFASGNAILVSYALIEYSDTTFSQAVSFEKGVGTVTLGASLTTTTLARTLVQSIAGSLNTTGVPTYQSPSAVNIGTAAHVLVFVGPSAADVPSYSPFYENTISGNDNIGVIADGTIGSTAIGAALTSLTDYYFRFRWSIPMVVRKCSMQVNTATGGGTSAAYARLYQINALGRPGKLLCDFGAFSATNCLNTASAIISTTALTNGFLLLPGEYFFDFLPQFSTGSPTMVTRNTNFVASNWAMGSQISIGHGPMLGATATGGTAGAAPDPANSTGYAVTPNNYCSLFFLNVS
ncbi:MAG TPA: hypothetical protein VMU69_04515 [Bradyrhizobium sp.]|nr:hypothetical protein [Bradyrhizobium sp.]